MSEDEKIEFSPKMEEFFTGKSDHDIVEPLTEIDVIQFPWCGKNKISWIQTVWFPSSEIWWAWSGENSVHRHDYGIRRNLGHGRRDLPQFSNDTRKLKNGRAFIIKSELSGSMKNDDFEYENAMTSVRNRRFMLEHSLQNPNPKRGELP